MTIYSGFNKRLIGGFFLTTILAATAAAGQGSDVEQLTKVGTLLAEKWRAADQVETSADLLQTAFELLYEACLLDGTEIACGRMIALAENFPEGAEEPEKAFALTAEKCRQGAAGACAIGLRRFPSATARDALAYRVGKGCEGELSGREVVQSNFCAIYGVYLYKIGDVDLAQKTLGDACWESDLTACLLSIGMASRENEPARALTSLRLYCDPRVARTGIVPTAPFPEVECAADLEWTEIPPEARKAAESALSAFLTDQL